MNRREFMEQLKKRLRKLPYDEAKEAIDYYEQYFDDAGAENEQTVLTELGSPANVAAQIIADFAIKSGDTEESPKQGLSTIWLIILAIFASPLALPLALAAVLLIAALVITILSVIVSIGATGLALLLAGIMSVVLSIPVFVQSISTALFYLGIGLVFLGFGASILFAAAVLSKKSFGWLAKHMGKFILRRSGK